MQRCLNASAHINPLQEEDLAKVLLKNDKGKVVMDKRVKEELERIKTCYNIQIDNPIALLNQDTAKTFLFKCQPDKLYDFFMRATQLKDCEEIYTEAEMNIKNAK